MSEPVTLRLGCVPSDRTFPFFIGEIAVPGFRIEPVANDEPAAIFRDMVQHGAFDLAEMSLGQCFEQAGHDQPPFVALPVFLSRMFRHGYIFVHRRAGIAHPRDLAGKRIGVQFHGMSAAVWIRQSLREEFGVDFSGVRWVEGPVNEVAHNVRVSGPSRAAGLVVEQAEGTTLSDLLAAGEIDAMIGAWVPKCFGCVPDVERLFPDPRAAEERFHGATGIFPIMHALVLRHDVHVAHSGLARALYDAFGEAKARMQQRHRATGALSTMLPWLRDALAETDAAFGGADCWPYGLEANRPTLEAFARALAADGAPGAGVPLERVFLGFD